MEENLGFGNLGEELGTSGYERTCNATWQEGMSLGLGSVAPSWVEMDESLSSRVALITCIRKCSRKSFGLDQIFCVWSSRHPSIPHLWPLRSPSLWATL